MIYHSSLHMFGTKSDLQYSFSNIQTIIAGLESQNHLKYRMIKQKFDDIMSKYNEQKPHFKTILVRLKEVQGMVEKLKGDQNNQDSLNRLQQLLKTVIDTLEQKQRSEVHIEGEDIPLDYPVLFNEQNQKRVTFGINSTGPVQSRLGSTTTMPMRQTQISSATKIRETLRNSTTVNGRNYKPESQEVIEAKKQADKQRRDVEDRINKEAEELQRNFQQQIKDLNSKLQRFEMQLKEVNKDYSKDVEDIWQQFGGKVVEFVDSLAQSTAYLQQCQERQGLILQSQSQVTAMMDQMCQLQKKADEYYTLMENVDEMKQYNDQLLDKLQIIEQRVNSAGMYSFE